MQPILKKTRDLTLYVLLSGGVAVSGLPSAPANAQRNATPSDEVLVTGRRPIAPSLSPIVVDKAINIIGVEGAKENESGRLTFLEGAVTFLTDKTTSVIPIAAIRSVAVDHTSKPLLRGVAGTLAGLAPNGGGQVYGAIRPGAEMLTIFYEDGDDALHGAVMLLSKSSKPAVIRAFARVGVPIVESSQIHDGLDRPVPQFRKASLYPSSGETRPTVMVTLPENDAVAVPTAITASAYEQLVAQSAKSGLFGTVWRQGDRRANRGTLRMTVRITGFKKGNAGVRGAIPVAGMIAGKTLITANVSLIDASGALLLDKEVEGSKRMMGESIGATKSLAQRVTGSIKKAPGFVKGPPAASRYEADEVAVR